VTGCTALEAQPLRGFNFLQSESLTLDRPGAITSMREMRDVGANTIVFVPFLRQGRNDSAEIGFSDAVTEHQLLTAMREARRLGLKVILKPQILASNGWPGHIKFGNKADEKRWFARYRDLLLYYAKIAEDEGAMALVIGTELDGVDSSSQWVEVIAALRRVYHGKLTYAAHGINGLHSFPAWDKLDVISVTLYPALGDGRTTELMRQRIDATLISLNAGTRELNKPVWILEVGLPSVVGGAEEPWEWMSLHSGSKPDTRTQATVISLWLDEIKKYSIDGVFFWCWYSNPQAGGLRDVDYTVQNKPAAQVIQCYWTGKCE